MTQQINPGDRFRKTVGGQVHEISIETENREGRYWWKLDRVMHDPWSPAWLAAILDGWTKVGEPVPPVTEPAETRLSAETLDELERLGRDATVAMSPAEELAATKSRAGKPTTKRVPIWRCSLRERRKRMGLTMDDVARAIGMTKSGYWVIENGSDPLLTTARKLATFFGVTVEALWPETAPATGEKGQE